MVKRCPICGLETRELSSFCPFDGQRLEPVDTSVADANSQRGPAMVSRARTGHAEKICPNCASQYPLRAKFCPRDGTRLEATGDISGSVVPPLIETRDQEEKVEERWDPDSLIGRTIATHYKLVEKIGQGGMGVVYKADHIRISRPAAIKILNPELAGDPEVVARFGREAEMASRLNHPNAVGIYDIGEEEGGFVYIAMEYVDGEQLSKIIERESFLTPLRAANIIRQVAGALDAAHQLKIVHRDLKPDNIMICRRAGKVDWVKVVDFGIAKQTQHGFGYQSVTRRGLILGTPEYMAPEQLLREPLDSRTDVYSLGLVAYKMLTGKLPFTGKNSQSRMVKKLTEQPRSFKEARPDLDFSSQIEDIVMKAISRERNDRYSTTLEFAAALERAAGGNPLYDPAAELWLRSPNTSVDKPSPLSQTDSTDAQTSDSEHQSTIITYNQKLADIRPPDKILSPVDNAIPVVKSTPPTVDEFPAVNPIPPTVDEFPSVKSIPPTMDEFLAVKPAPPTSDEFPAIKETRPVTPNAIEHAPAEWSDHSPEEDISSWHAAPAHIVAEPAPSKKRRGWILFILIALLLILAIVAAVILWRSYKPQPAPVAEEAPATTDTTNQIPSQAQIVPQSIAQADGRESMTISMPEQQAENKSQKERPRNQSKQPAADSTTESAATATEPPPAKEETPEKDNSSQPAQPEPTVEEKPHDPVRRSQGVVHGSVVRRIEPSYPNDALRRGVKGTIVVEVMIDETGKVISATALSGPEPLRDAAVRAAKRWRFKPTLLNGAPSKSSRIIEFNFVKDQ